MSKCFNPDCLHQNPDQHNFCEKCGQKLLLMERYRGINYLGEGGFGRTFLARDQAKRNSVCVIKQFLPLSQGSGALKKCIELFEQEAELLEKLGKHPQIPDLLAFFEQDSKLYLIQEYIEGQDILKNIQKHKRFNENVVKTFLLQMLPVLDFIHQKSVIHRDIKPENILIRKKALDPLIYGKTSKLVLIDFGVSKQITSTIMTKMGTSIGTPAYAPPEQNRGIVNASSDLYSLAVTAIRMLTGVLPEERNGSVVDEIFDVYSFTWCWKEWLVKNNISINQNLAEILDQMLADKISDRFQSAREVLTALKVLNKNVIETPIKTQNPSKVPDQYKKEPISSPQNTNSSQNSLKSVEYKIKQNYQKLEGFLKQKDWKNANKETSDRMLEILDQSSWLEVKQEQLLIFPQEDLIKIDQLWLKYSNNKFGFSVQKQIWLDCGVKLGVYNWDIYDKFAHQIGWRKNGNWLSYSDIILNSGVANVGCFPLFLGGYFDTVVLKYYGMLEKLLCSLLSHPELKTNVNNNPNSTPSQAPLPNNVTNQNKPKTLPQSNLILTPLFHKLDQLLASENWQGADLETANIMLIICNRKSEGWLTENNCKNFLSKDLKIIDQLWLKYSNNKFGFSVQKQIWLDCGGSLGIYNRLVYEKFSATIGWTNIGNILYYKNLTFNLLNAPLGHLPSRKSLGVEITGVFGWEYLFNKL